ncbi:MULTISPECIES: acyl-CoA dehydrogenase family protein [unclassified Hyphomonas]|jgi:alkylation response protein AidB-like acyl-CoA dehydrogenase|uniref:acyl-CoA dehydrogenase family protein n=1 Tax=unclassified Hyphomonas TaxID=2630699 RepID=UPI000458E073|nr:MULTISPECIES: acyl-CoA dehydrogenase family protein [unclassified Hyphomonas]KCZ46969.1 hypothetical protein HY17_06080 [Hyphomonas sp. CY54-11-8]RAN39017.1 hypothetical protein HY26_03185 [Hyphomonas sp. GM-8P]
MADTNAAPVRNTEQLTDELVERARAIAPAIAARAETSERDRRVADETIADVAEAGLFEILVPQRYGGHELGISSMVKVMKALSPLDVSTGWTLAFYMVHNWMWCLLPEEAQKEIFADGPSRLGPVMVAPTVKAQPEAGGYRINGRAKWGTGSSHAQWCMVSGIVEEDLPEPVEGQPPRPPAVRMFAMPWSEAKLEDTWRTSGMAATASHDVIFDNIFIPAHRVMDATPARSGEAEGAQIHDSSVYTSAFTPMLCVAALSAIVSGTLGAAGHAVERAKTFLSTFSGRTSVDNPALQIRLAKADLAAQTASRMIDALAQEIESDATMPPIPLENRARQRAMSSHIASICRDAVTLLAQGSGASGHMSDSPIQRAFRDINMASCHVVFDQDPTMELHGKMLVGRPPPIILA